MESKVSENIRINAANIAHKELNSMVKQAVMRGVKRIELFNVHGQRYIGTDILEPVEITIEGTPGNDLGAFMNGQRLLVYGNAQDGSGNTMNGGEIIIHGHAGDITGLAVRGGQILVRDDVGYRAGIHMKEYKEKKPVFIVGGTAQDFAGEYMAGGVMVLLGLNLEPGSKHNSRYIGTGMHGGIIYIRGDFEDYQLGKEVGVAELDEADIKQLSGLVNIYTGHFGGDATSILNGKFKKLYPRSLRPYGRLYAY